VAVVVLAAVLAVAEMAIDEVGLVAGLGILATDVLVAVERIGLDCFEQVGCCNIAALESCSSQSCCRKKRGTKRTQNARDLQFTTSYFFLVRWTRHHSVEKFVLPDKTSSEFSRSQ
jgi:hypothetical protein